MTNIGLGVGLGLDIEKTRARGPFFSKNRPGESPVPSRYGDPLFVYDPAVGITVVGGLATALADQSGNGNNIAQGSVPEQPVYNGADANFGGKPSLTFDGADDHLFLTTFIAGDTVRPTQPFIVYKFATTVGTSTLYDGTGGGRGCMLRNVGGTEQMFAGLSVQPVFSADTDPHIFTGVYNGTPSKAWKDGVKAEPASNIGTSNFAGIIFGGNNNGLENMNGEIAYMCAFEDEISNDNRNAFAAELSAYFGITYTPNDSLLSLPGSSGNFASIADTASLSAGPDMKLLAAVAPDDWTPGSNIYFCGKWNATGNNREYLLGVTATTGTLRFLISNDGSGSSTYESTVAPTVSDGQLLYVYVAHWNAGGNKNIEFYTSTDGIAFTKLGDTIVFAGTATAFDGTAAFEVGSHTAGTGGLWAGEVKQVQMFDFAGGVEGDKLVDIDFKEENVAETSFTEVGINDLTVTVNQSGSPDAEIIAA